MRAGPAGASSPGCSPAGSSAAGSSGAGVGGVASVEASPAGRVFGAGLGRSVLPGVLRDGGHGERAAQRQTEQGPGPASRTGHERPRLRLCSPHHGRLSSSIPMALPHTTATRNLNPRRDDFCHVRASPSILSGNADAAWRSARRCAGRRPGHGVSHRRPIGAAVRCVAPGSFSQTGTCRNKHLSKAVSGSSPSQEAPCARRGSPPQPSPQDSAPCSGGCPARPSPSATCPMPCHRRWRTRPARSWSTFRMARARPISSRSRPCWATTWTGTTPCPSTRASLSVTSTISTAP